MREHRPVVSGRLTVDLPKWLRLRAHSGEEQVGGLAFLIVIPTTKNPLKLLPVGPSDTDVDVVVTSDLLAREVKLSEFPMDHGASLGEMWISIASLRDLDGLRRGYEIWRDHFPFPPGYLDQLANYEDAVRSNVGRRLRPAATVIGGSMKVATSPMVA